MRPTPAIVLIQPVVIIKGALAVCKYIEKPYFHEPSQRTIGIVCVITLCRLLVNHPLTPSRRLPTISLKCSALSCPKSKSTRGHLSLKDFHAHDIVEVDVLDRLDLRAALKPAHVVLVSVTHDVCDVLQR